MCTSIVTKYDLPFVLVSLGNPGHADKGYPTNQLTFLLQRRQGQLVFDGHTMDRPPIGNVAEYAKTVLDA